MSNSIFGNEPFGLWRSVSDENLILQRVIVPGTAYEMVHVTNEGNDIYKLLHEVIFCDDYNKGALEKVLDDFGYKSLEEFVRECSEQELEEGGDVFEHIDWETLSMFICDTHDDGILMTGEEISKEVKRITGIELYSGKP